MNSQSFQMSQLPCYDSCDAALTKSSFATHVTSRFPYLSPDLLSYRYDECDIRSITIYGEKDEDYFAFHYWLDLPRNLSYNGNIELEGEFAGIGLARALVEFREEHARNVGIRRIIINRNQNPDFWKHMGYEILSDSEKLSFIPFDTRNAPAMYKNL